VAKNAARLFVLLIVSGITGLLGWALYPASDRPPSTLLGRIQLDVGAQDLSPQFTIFPEVHVLRDGNTRLDLTVTSFRSPDDNQTQPANLRR
jgi:hypothetical protein